MAVSDYSTTPASNTAISGINVGEGMAPAGVNDAIRQMMADAKTEKESKDAILGTGTVSALVGVTKQTQALLYADLAWADGTFALVWGDATPAKNDLYRKSGASGVGSWSAPLGIFAGAAQALVQTIADAATASATSAAASAASITANNSNLGVMMTRAKLLRPSNSKPFAAMKMSDLRWWIATFVEGGNRMDYAVHEFYDHGAAQSPAVANCWRYNGVVAVIDGLYEEFANFTGENVGAGIMDSLPPPIWEPVPYIGPHTGGTFDFVGPGHGHLSGSTSAIYLNGDTGTNYRLAANAPVGKVIRGTAITFDQSFPVTLPDNVTAAGTLVLGHAMVTGGVQVSGSINFTGTNIGMRTFYGGMMSGRGDMLKAEDIAAIAADQEDDLEYGAGGVVDADLGQRSAFALYTDGRQTHLLEMIHNGVGGGPLANGGSYGWPYVDGGARHSWLQARGEGYAKIYSAGVNRAASLLVDGMTFSFNTTYRVRKGAAL